MEEKETRLVKIKNIIAVVCAACGAVLTVLSAVLAGVAAAKNSFSVAVAAAAIAAVSGCVLTALGVVYFILDRRITENLAARAVAAEEIKERVVSDVSRNIRTPMTSVIGLTDIAKANIDDKEKVLNCLEKIAESGRQIVEVINGLPDVESCAETAGRTENSPETVKLEGRRILVAEDNELNWLMAENLITGAGMIAVRAENGQDCVDKLLEKRPCIYDAVLMDLRMPVMDGFETTRVIRSLKRGFNSVPIIAMTADALSEDVKKCFDCGMNAHIAKPIDIEALKAVLIKYIKP